MKAKIDALLVNLLGRNDKKVPKPSVSNHCNHREDRCLGVTVTMTQELDPIMCHEFSNLMPH